MGCPIRRSRDQRSLAAPPSLSQLATSFIACDAKVSTCALLCTFVRASIIWVIETLLSFKKLHPLAHGNMRTDRSHVWHMKVLHYTVFKVQKDATRAGIDHKTRSDESDLLRIAARGHSLKAEQCSRKRLIGYFRNDGEASCVTKLEKPRADLLSPTLARTGRRTPGETASSVVDVSMYATAFPATGEPVACTP